MRKIAYDFEVFRHWWCCTFESVGNGSKVVVENDGAQLRQILSLPNTLFVGFNSKHYDQAIAKAAATGADNLTLKELNDWIVGDRKLWWNFPWFQGRYFNFATADVRDDMQMGLSLKSIEGHLGLSIVESSVPFDLDRPLTEEEKADVIRYCQYDTSVTATLIRLREGYFTAKKNLGEMAGLNEADSLALTNAKLVARYLGARSRVWDDERLYVIPETVKNVPEDVREFFARMDDPDIDDDELFKSKLNTEIGGVPTVFGFGGIHGAIPTYQETETERRGIWLYDVTGMYPNTMINYGYVSRNIPDPEAFAAVVAERELAKASGDTAKANAFKLVTNTAYGAMLNQYNALYDPRMGRSVCITGQLSLADFALRLVAGLRTIKLIQLNTDGVMFSIDKTEVEGLEQITKEWETATGCTMEPIGIKKIIQRDVNNYYSEALNGKIKVKGGDLVRGISTAGAFNINNDAVIVTEAMIAYFKSGVDPEITINNCSDVAKYQMIAKAGGKYSKVIHEAYGARVEMQKVNRVFASPNDNYGTLRKLHKETGSWEKIASIPLHCEIFNGDLKDFTGVKIDRQWYINEAKRKINRFIGERVFPIGKEKNRVA